MRSLAQRLQNALKVQKHMIEFLKSMATIESSYSKQVGQL